MHAFRKIHITLLSILLLFIWLAGPVQANTLDDVRELINANYVDPVDETILEAGSVEELLKRLDDPHSDYFTTEQYKVFLDSIGDSNFSGLGVHIDSVPEGILITNVIPGSSAEASNIRPGDIILSADGKSLQGLTTEEAVPIIRGPEHSMINLIIKRGASRISLSIQRKTVVVPSVTHELLPANIAYIDINSFGLESPGQFQQALNHLRSQGAKSYIIDLRNNSGGYLSSALNIAGYFIGANVAVNVESKNIENRSSLKSNHTDTSIEEPVIFLVNEFSASASEILAAAVQDHDQALVIGNTTYGKGSIQTLYALLSSEGFLKLTTARFLSPSGKSVDGVGVIPDLIITESDPLHVAQLLLGYSESPYLDQNRDLTIRVGKFQYTIDTMTANTATYWSAYREIISQIPDYSLYRIGGQSDWQVAEPGLLDTPWFFYFPNYMELNHLEDVPTDKQFLLTFTGPIERQSIRQDTVELIDSVTGQRIPLEFFFLGSKQLLVTPKTSLVPETVYWMVLHPGVELKTEDELEGSIITISVGNSASLESVKIQ